MYRTVDIQYKKYPTKSRYGLDTLGDRLRDMSTSVLASHAVYVALNSASSCEISVAGVFVVSTSLTQDLIRSILQLEELEPSGSVMASVSLAFSMVTDE